MEAKTNYTKVGIIVLILIAGLLSAILWLSVGFNQKSYSTYTVYLHEPASGLTEEAPVKYNGVRVGYVKEIKLNKNDPRQVEILLNIEEGTPITTSTAATLISQGITGVTYVGLSAGSSNLTPLRKMPDEPYPVIPAKPSLFNQLDTILKEVSEDVGKLSDQAQHIFSEKNSRHITNTLANLEKLSKILANNSTNINSSLKNANIFLENAAVASHDFPHLLKQLKTGIGTFNSMAGALMTAGSNVSKTMVSGKNTLDKLSQEAIPPTIELLHRLNAISANIEQISNEMRQNPSVVIRGSTAPKPGPGE